MAVRKFTDRQEEHIAELYKSGISGMKLCKRFGCSNQLIYRALRRQGISARDNRKYRFDQDYFGSVDSEEKAYWLGFIMADGHVRVRKGSKSLVLTSIDFEHLEKFKKAIKHGGDIKPHSNNTYRFEACSGLVVKDLITLGVVPRKSFCTSVSPIDKKLIRHFIRGVVDGDGGIGYYGDSWRISISPATQSFINDLKTIINKDFGIDGGGIDKRGKTFVLTFGGNAQAYNLGNILYGDSSIYLDRKYKRYMKLCKYINNPIKDMIIKIFKYCSMPNCGKILYAKDLCRFHYDQKRYYGELNYGIE